MVHVVNGDQLQSLLTVIKYLTKDIEDKEETFAVLRSKMLKLLSKSWLENDSAALDESIKSLLQFTDDELSELRYGASKYFTPRQTVHVSSRARQPNFESLPKNKDVFSIRSKSIFHQYKVDYIIMQSNRL